jgi:hypothetical protein
MPLAIQAPAEFGLRIEQARSAAAGQQQGGQGREGGQQGGGQSGGQQRQSEQGGQGQQGGLDRDKDRQGGGSQNR